MYEIITLIILALVWMTFAVIQDLRTREVSNWLNFSLIVFAIGFRFFYSLFSSPLDFSFFYSGLIGLGIFFVLGNLFYYSRVFGGGDAKLLISLGAILPLNLSFQENIWTFTEFLLIFLFVGSVYGLCWSVYLAVKNSKKFKKEFLILIKENKLIVIGSSLVGLLICFFGFLDIIFMLLGIFIIFISYLYFFAKSIDSCCMTIEVSSKKLREGDLLFKDLKFGKKIIKADWEGVSLKDIKFISKHFKNVKIKQGIPFVPVFFISFLILVYLFFKELI